MVFREEYLKEISFPLGGIGSGCIGLSGNGELIDWEIFNRPNKNDDGRFIHRHSHIAVRAFDEEGNIVDARVLVGDRDKNYSGTGQGVSNKR